LPAAVISALGEALYGDAGDPGAFSIRAVPALASEEESLARAGNALQ